MTYIFRSLEIPLNKKSIHYFNNSTTLLIPYLYDCVLPSNMVFPNAKIIVPYNWDKNAVVFNLNRTKFPNVKYIHYLSKPPHVSLEGRFDKNVKWIFPRIPSPIFNFTYQQLSCHVNKNLNNVYEDMYSQLKINNHKEPVNPIRLHNDFVQYCYHMYVINNKNNIDYDNISTLKLLGADEFDENVDNCI
jgi:hypothetical protein